MLQRSPVNEQVTRPAGFSSSLPVRTLILPLYDHMGACAASDNSAVPELSFPERAQEPLSTLLCGGTESGRWAKIAALLFKIPS